MISVSNQLIPKDGSVQLKIYTVYGVMSSSSSNTYLEDARRSKICNTLNTTDYLIAMQYGSKLSNMTHRFNPRKNEAIRNPIISNKNNANNNSDSKYGAGDENDKDGKVFSSITESKHELIKMLTNRKN
ncbi:hypothetical protein BVG19_g3294 [[Candida] boidinii]|nr:hypothetical protein BVG19_g3294 [[Candida] boidinii]